MPIKCVVTLMVFAGILGGVVNYGLARPARFEFRDCFWSVVIGVAAALLVPLFLNTISSSLLINIVDGSAHTSDIFVFFGFCLLGAIASRSMIHTLTNKILRSAEEAKEKVDNLEKNIAPILIKETEPEIKQEEQEPEPLVANNGFSFRGFGLVGIEPPKIIRALGSSKYSRRTAKGISKESGESEEKCIEILEWLQKNGLAFTTGSPKHYWSLTQEGRATFGRIIEGKS